MKIGNALVVALSLTAIWSSALAEVPPWHQEKLDREPLIVSGVITKLSRQNSAQGECTIDIETTMTILEDQNRKQYVVKADNFQLCPMVTGKSGVWFARDLKVGDRIKVYASVMSDGTYVIAAPNGIVRLSH